MTDVPIEFIGDNDFGVFLDRTLCIGLAYRPGWEAKILAHSPAVGPYLVSGIRNGIRADMHAIKVDIPEPFLYTEHQHVSCPWDIILQGISAPIAIVCAAGGVKAFIELLKVWVEERKGHKVRIRKGNIEIEFQGGVSLADIERATKILEEKSGESTIIQP